MTRHNPPGKQRGLADAGPTDSAQKPPMRDGRAEQPSPQGESECVVQMGDKDQEERRSRIGDYR